MRRRRRALRSHATRTRREQRLELGKSLVADALDLAQIIDRREIAVGTAIFDDGLGAARPDTRQRIELGFGGGVQVKRSEGEAATRRRTAGRRSVDAWQRALRGSI
jgi:hypothetical protein